MKQKQNPVPKPCGGAERPAIRRGIFIKQTGMYFLMSCKRLLARPVYLVILALMPLVVFGLSDTQKEEAPGITAMICLEGYDPEAPEDAAARIRNNLLGEEGTVRFVPADSEEEVRQAVLRKEAECGYVFPEEFGVKLAQDDWKRSVTLYSGQDSLIPTLVNELVYTAVFREYSSSAFVDYMGTVYETAAEGRSNAENKAEELLNLYLTNGSTFSFSYHGSLSDAQAAYEKEIGEGSKLKADVVPVKGMLALFMMLCAFCGLVDYKKDREAGRLVWVRHRLAAQVIMILIPALGAGAMSLVCIFAAGAGSPIHEITNVIIYILLLTAYTAVWGMLFQSEHAVVASVPFLMIACVLFCPIFWNLKAVLPVLQGMEKLFPVSWYLAMG